jgi:L-fucose mutarotase/ribose pyranase (RbsD/FucU family)
MIGWTVRVYKNIPRSRQAGHPVYSIQDMHTRRVVAHSDHVVLSNAEFVVSEAGRQRVLREQRKNVHAYVIGVFIERLDLDDIGASVITYNPYKGPTFVTLPTGNAVKTAERVVLADQVLAWGIYPN